MSFSSLFSLFSIFFVLSLALAETPMILDATTSSCQAACAQLSSLFNPSNLHFPGHDEQFIVWDAKQQEIQSACRVTPSTTKEVAQIMEILVGQWCRFAVKGGGHARNADDSVSVGGVTIDMVRMKSVEVAPDRTSARLGAGHVLFTLYSGLEAYNLSTTGGRVADVGLGGYALGGGISNFSPKYGLAVDNVFQYELVLPNGTIALVTATSHPDLYFALRGGMNNFGIVTHFTMRTFPQHHLFSGNRVFAVDQRDLVVQEAYKLTTLWKNDTDLAFSYGFAYSQASGEFTLSVTEAYARPILDPKPYETLNSAPYLSSTLRTNWMSNFSLEGASARPPGGRNLYASISYYPSSNLDKQIQDAFVEEIQPIKMLPGFSPNIIFQPLYEAAIRHGRDRGGSALGLETEGDGPLTMLLLTTQWSSATDDYALYSFADRFITRVKDITVRAGKEHRWMYINYAYQGQDPFAGYGEVNRQRLKRIQRELDGKGVFTSRGLCRGYFKVN